jgi:hypothetical protein
MKKLFLATVVFVGMCASAHATDRLQLKPSDVRNHQWGKAYFGEWCGRGSGVDFDINYWRLKSPHYPSEKCTEGEHHSSSTRKALTPVKVQVV